MFVKTRFYAVTFGIMLNKLVPKSYKILGYQVYAFGTMSTKLALKP